MLVFLGGVDPSHHFPLVQYLALHQTRLLGDGFYRPLLRLDRHKKLLRLLLQLLLVFEIGPQWSTPEENKRFNNRRGLEEGP